jgi:hypothetical protein
MHLTLRVYETLNSEGEPEPIELRKAEVPDRLHLPRFAVSCGFPYAASEQAVKFSFWSLATAVRCFRRAAAPAFARSAGPP